jgi:hypothetical protein
MKYIKNNLAVIVIFILALVIYWTTTYPSITWWDSSEYSTAAACLGLTGAPGSIILTLLGWILSKFTSHNPAYLFNLFVGFITSLTVICIFLSFKKIQALTTEKKQDESTLIKNVSLILASGIIICSSTLWEYAIMFTPYNMTALFTVLILLAVLNWWKNADNSDSWKSLFIVTLLIGIDFSVHRTNAVLIPGIIVMMLIRNYKIMLNYKSYLSAISGIILGLSIQLLYIPMSLNDPLFNMGETNNLLRWWDFISLKQYGGNFLFDILHRKSPFWTYQIPYYAKGFSDNFFYFNHSTIILGFIPALLGLIGIGYLYKNNRKIALALVLFFIITIVISISYFNIPANYFRSLYRHFLPTYVVFSVFIFLGSSCVMNNLLSISHRRKYLFVSVSMILILGVSLTQYWTNFYNRNSSKNTFTIDHASNIINSIDRHGIVFSTGDNLYFPELYLQIAEKKRLDILHCNLGLLNVDWYIKQNQRHDKEFPFSEDGIDISKYEFKDWKTKYCSIAIADNVKKEYSTQVDTFHLSLPALRQNKSIFLGDWVLFNIFKNNKWERPIYFIKLGFESELYNWLKPYLRDEGLVFEFVPDSSLVFGEKKIEIHLDRFVFSGYNNYSIPIDDVARIVSGQYYEMYLEVAGYKTETKDWNGASSYMKQMKKFLPFDRLYPDQEVIERTEQFDELIKSNLRE